MKSVLKYKRFFAFSDNKNMFYNTDFCDGINVIHGKNTSGKSTLMQAILYTFGINDEKAKLEELLREKVIFRLDIILKNETTEEISVVREDEFLIIKRSGLPVKKFTGISGDNSAEHILLKEYLGDLFGFDLYLESSGEYKPASIEAMFLPYYIAQDVGWVYRHKSFRGLDYIKNFKNDFFDYYLGISNDYDREEKRLLETEKTDYENEIKFLECFESKNDDIKLSKIKDEKFIVKSVEYIEPYKKNKADLIKLEKEYLIESNRLSYLEQRKSILKRVKSALKKQVPLENNCPTCYQLLPNSIAEIYEYFQDCNDTEKQLSRADEIISNLKRSQGKLNSLEIKINKLKKIISRDYAVLNKYIIDDLTFNTWVDNKANVKLSENITTQIGEISIKLNKTIAKLAAFKTDIEITRERNKKDQYFKNYFETKLSDLGVKRFEDDRFALLYKSPAFPKQGVELLKTLLAYSFSFNEMIKQTDYVHRFPFMLDAIFEGDLDDDNRKIILDFIYNNKPSDTQIIISIADSKDNKTSASDYNREHLKNTGKLICIGNNSKERAFLSEYNNEFDDYLDETLAYLDTN